MAPIKGYNSKRDGALSPGTSVSGGMRNVGGGGSGSSKKSSGGGGDRDNILKDLEKAIADREKLNATRDEFFKGNMDISDDRLRRRQTQQDLVEQFKAENMYMIPGTNAYAYKKPGGMTLEEYRQQVANEYGPTLGEIGSDIMGGLGSMAGGLGEFIGGGGITGAILKAITGAKNVGKKGLDFLGQMFTRGPVSDVPMGPIATPDNIAEAEVLAQLQSGSPTVDALTGQTYTNLYGGNRDYSSFLANEGIPSIIIDQMVTSPVRYTDEDFTGENTLDYMDFDGRPFIKTNL